MSNYYAYIKHPVSGERVQAAFIDFGDHYKVQVLAEPYGVFKPEEVEEWELTKQNQEK